MPLMDASSSPLLPHCSSHPENSLFFYCDTHSVPVCMACTIVRHRTDVCTIVNIGAQKQAYTIDDCVTDIRAALARLDAASTTPLLRAAVATATPLLPAAATTFLLPAAAATDPLLPAAAATDPLLPAAAAADYPLSAWSATFSSAFASQLYAR